jgi:hypothetical protein
MVFISNESKSITNSLSIRFHPFQEALGGFLGSRLLVTADGEFGIDHAQLAALFIQGFEVLLD